MQEAYSRPGIAWALPRPIPCRGCGSHTPQTYHMPDEGDKNIQTSSDRRVIQNSSDRRVGCAIVVSRSPKLHTFHALLTEITHLSCTL